MIQIVLSWLANQGLLSNTLAWMAKVKVNCVQCSHNVPFLSLDSSVPHP